MKIEQISNKHDEDIEFSDFTLLVGPNNAGKSQTLRDIRDIMVDGEDKLDTTIISNIEFENVSYDEFFLGSNNRGR